MLNEIDVQSVTPSSKWPIYYCNGTSHMYLQKQEFNICMHFIQALKSFIQTCSVRLAAEQNKLRHI